MKQENFEEACRLRREIVDLKVNRLDEADALNRGEIVHVVVHFKEGRPIEISADVIGVDILEVIRKVLENYDAEIARLEKLFEEL